MLPGRVVWAGRDMTKRGRRGMHMDGYSRRPPPMRRAPTDAGRPEPPEARVAGAPAAAAGFGVGVAALGGAPPPPC